eukprot:gene2992-4249_t
MAHILRIDDGELLRAPLLQMLELDGHRVTEAGDGEAGLRLFGQGNGFDAVITDILMPGVDGTRVIVELRKRRPPEFNLQTAALAGADRQLAKPFSRQDLQSALRQTRAPDILAVRSFSGPTARIRRAPAITPSTTTLRLTQRTTTATPLL